MREVNYIAGDDGLYKLGAARNMASNTSNAAIVKCRYSSVLLLLLALLLSLLREYTHKRELDVKRVRVIFVKYYESKV